MKDDTSALGDLVEAIKNAANQGNGDGKSLSKGLAPVRVNWDNVDTDIERQGKKIILPSDPADMPIDKAIEALKKKQKDEDQPYNVFEFIPGSPSDAAIAFVKAMQRTYGWASPQSTPGFFGPKPPTMKSVRTGPGKDDFIQVPFGAFSIPNVKNNINTAVIPDNKSRPTFLVHGEVLKRERHILLDLVTKAREIMQTESIYRGRAITINANSEGQINWFEDVSFIDTSKNTELLFNDDVMQQIETNLWAPIKHTEQCRQHKIPLKRGVLLEGPYGTGKSLTARATAKVASDNNWTFINLTNASALKDALAFAEIYAPAVLFAEDIDRVMGQRNERANDIVNTIDGVVSKTSEVITVLTTNHVDQIEQVMLRPGRLDAVISVSKPNAKTAEKLIRLYGRNLIQKNEDLSAAGAALAGQIPATIREIVERSKLSMVSLGHDYLTSEAIQISADGMAKHMALLADKKVEKSVADMFYEVFRDMVGAALTNSSHDATKMHALFQEMVIDDRDMEGSPNHSKWQEITRKLGVASE